MLARLRCNLAWIDYWSLGFHAYMLARAVWAPPSELARASVVGTSILLAAVVLTLVAVRGEVLSPGFLRSFIYRAGMTAPAILSYLKLRFLLPALEPTLLDPWLLRLDNAIFGITPALLLERWNARPAVEWFSFFYYFYFIIVGSHVVLSLFFVRGRMLREMAVGALVLISLGHVFYTFVPGVGPIAYLSFQAPLDGGFWYGTVMSAVESSGAHLDIFPSLHTAFPVFFSLYSLRYRKHPVYRITGPMTIFATLNMVGATLFLRWHYGIDVIIGLLLAAAVMRLSIAIADWEERRQSPDRQADWEYLWTRAQVASAASRGA